MLCHINPTFTHSQRYFIDIMFVHLFRIDQRDVVQYLLNEVHCNPNCTNMNGDTPLSLTTDPIITRELFSNGANPAGFYERYGKHLPAESVNTFVIGHQGCGKSTISKALGQQSKGLACLTSRLVKVTGVDAKTAGIIPYDIHNDQFGNLAVYDFAGHKEYYGSHCVVLRSVTMGSSAALFFLVADLRSSDTEFRNTITYWLHFLKTDCTRSTVGPEPHVIIVGSFADKIKSKSELFKKHEIVKSLLSTGVFSGIHYSSFVLTNCCFSESSSMSELRHTIAKSCEVLKIKAKMSFNSHCFFIYLLDRYHQYPAVTLDTIHTRIQRGCRHELKEFLPRTILELCKACEDLNDRGSILFVKKTDDVKGSWIILHKEALLSQVTGTVFAPEGLKEYKALATSTGVVPFTNISSHFPTIDPHMVVDYMCYLEFCHEVVDHEALQFLQAPTISLADSTTKYYFFPGLVRTEAPPDIWKADPKFVYRSGWVLQCCLPHEFLSPHFLQVLLLRLAFPFALALEQHIDHPALHRKCSVWKNGIFWANRDGVDCLVEIAESKQVILMLQCLKACEIQCVNHRSLIIRKINDTLEQLCSQVSTTSGILLPSEVSYPLESTKRIQFTICEVAKAAVEAKPGSKPSAVSEDSKLATLEELLFFEPYSDLGRQITTDLCSESMKDSKITDNFLEHIVDRIENKKLFIHLFKSTAHNLQESTCEPLSCSDDARELVQGLKLWRNRGEGTYQCLRRELDKFSVFAGKNPLVID